MQYKLDAIPFSRYGCYFAVSSNKKDNALYLRDLHGGDETYSDIYKIVFLGQENPELNFFRTESELIWSGKDSEAEQVKICMDKAGCVHIVAEGMNLELHACGGRYDTLVPLSARQLEHHLYKKQRKFLFTCVEGQIAQRQDWNIVGSKDAVITIYGKTENNSHIKTHCVLESYRCVWDQKEYPTYETARNETQAAYEAWQSSFPNRCGTFEESRKLAAYISWANFVPANGFLTHDAMYMSKNWMLNIWSWDNCFGGIALSQAYPELAWGQLKIFMDNQDSSGCYADYICEAVTSFNCVKPPIHSWAFRKMSKQNDFFRRKEILREVYGSLCRVTQYWLEHRCVEGAVMPVYFHGNDSGWDNASVFHQGFPVESPDLSAFLIYQMDRLAELAKELGEEQQATEWQQKADCMYGKFLERFYYEGRLYAWHTPTQQRITQGDSLLMYMPLQIAYRMERSLADQLVKDLLSKFEMPYGLATENPQSPYYKKCGYWLGPIWAPVSYLLIDALRENGYKEDAHRLAEKFCRLTVKGLMSENYDPFCGEGYDDPAFAWPSCVLLQLLCEYDDLQPES